MGDGGLPRLPRDLAGAFSARRGPYRLLYRVDDDAKTVTALRIAHRAVLLENGRVVLSGSAAELSRREDIQRFYLGHAASEQGRLETLKATLRAERASG